MATAVRYDLFLPLKFNDGTPIPPATWKHIEDTLIERFGGVTAVRQEFPLRGLWRGATQVYEDEISIVTTIDFDNRADSRTFFGEYRERLKQDFRQAELLITAQSIDIV